MKATINNFSLAFLSMAFSLLYVANAVAHEIALDPGHSHNSPGARSCSGIYEYVYNSDLVNTTVEYLFARGVQVDVTRTQDGEISLLGRAKKSAGKKLFISVHHDSAQPQFIKYVNGNPCSTKARGYSIFVSEKNDFFKESLACAQVLSEALQNFGYQPSTHHGENIKGENRKSLDGVLGIYLFDDLAVLSKAKSPALLLEAAVIINADDDNRAKTKKFQLEVAEALANTITFAVNNF